MGRRSTYSEKVAVEIASRIAEGSSLHKVAQEPGMPSIRTVLRWCQERPAFGQLLAQARLHKADRFFDDAIDIADEPVRDAADAARQRTRVQARQHYAARLNPARYGERLGLGQAAEFGHLVPDSMSQLELARRVAYTLQVGMRARALKAPGHDVQDAVPKNATNQRH